MKEIICIKVEPRIKKIIQATAGKRNVTVTAVITRAIIEMLIRDGDLDITVSKV